MRYTPAHVADDNADDLSKVLGSYLRKDLLYPEQVEHLHYFIAADDTTTHTWFEPERRSAWIAFLWSHARDDDARERLAQKDLDDDLIQFSQEVVIELEIPLETVLAAYVLIFRS
jgi:hypothetical protein